MTIINLKPAGIKELEFFLPLVLKEPYIADSPKLLIDRLLNQSSYSVYDGNKLIGLVNIGLRRCPVNSDNEFYLRLIFILDNYRKNGYGKKVLEYLENKYRKLWAIVDKNNQSAISLFKKSGWKSEVQKNKIIFQKL